MRSNALPKSKVNPPNKLLSPQKFIHHVMLLFIPFCYEKQLLSVCPSLCQNKRQELGVHDIVNRNKRKFEPYENSSNI